ncbi:MAG TPA: hypothetical protein VLA72_09035 [Anaerolineales bacterium]|nr:hypothetical protein [Anaerolineales bacterium]
MPGNKDISQSEHQDPGSQLQTFTLRIWVTNQEDANLEWRGRIQHVQSGEVQYCQNWDAFIAYVEEVLHNPSGI